ncbi:uncharacterized protein LOC110838764 isoform X3 [Zootermopsis nevadensis]|uniref:uncharacterized protein LOC110838764 isoform X3 n=1 Tax=Zootermopsis nevadensis TaxID=136037 RepID=UPI000B8E4F85|nr:uncharacterized protein LOC110838764 isoform X3 [Zootermopsis nevadensis]
MLKSTPSRPPCRVESCFLVHFLRQHTRITQVRSLCGRLVGICRAQWDNRLQVSSGLFYKMLDRRDSYSHNFICVTATVLLLLGYSNCVLAQDAAGTIASHLPAQSAVSSANTSANSSLSSASKSAATQAVTNGNQTLTNGTQPVTNGTSLITNITKSDNTNQTEGTSALDSPSEPSLLTIFLVSDLQYDIFPVYRENRSLCDVGDVGDEEKCEGGLPSLKSFMEDNHDNNSYEIWLNAGNTLGGDLFRTLKFKTALRAMQDLPFNATAVGSNVFKYGGEAGQSYLDGLNETVVVSNIDPAPRHKSLTFAVENCSVSVIGYVDSSEQDIHGVSVKNYTESIIEEVERISKEHQNDTKPIIVVIGSSTVNKSKAIASIDGIDFVFFSGANWSQDAAPSKGGQNVSQYFCETVNKTSVNKTARVCSLKVNHTSETGRFIIGKMQLPITNSCSVANAEFDVVHYQNSTQNKEALDLIKTERRRLQRQNEPLTENTKNLTAERDICSYSECSLGNLIADSMVAALRSDGTLNKSSTTIGIFPASHLRPNGTIPEGNVTAMDLYDLIDQDAYIYSVLLTGCQLKDILEISIKSVNNSNQTDFLHVSGLLQIEYRNEHENNSEIASVKTVSAASLSMLLREIDVNDSATFYNVTVPLTLLKMENYKKLLGAVNASYHPVTVVEAVTRYINNTRFLLLPAVGTRLIPIDSRPAPSPAVVCENHMATIVIVTLIIAALVVGLLYGVWRWRSIRSHLMPGYINF